MFPPFCYLYWCSYCNGYELNTSLTFVFWLFLHMFTCGICWALHCGICILVCSALIVVFTCGLIIWTFTVELHKLCLWCSPGIAIMFTHCLSKAWMSWPWFLHVFLVAVYDGDWAYFYDYIYLTEGHQSVTYKCQGSPMTELLGLQSVDKG